MRNLARLAAIAITVAALSAVSCKKTPPPDDGAAATEPAAGDNVAEPEAKAAAPAPQAQPTPAPAPVAVAAAPAPAAAIPAPAPAPAPAVVAPASVAQSRPPLPDLRLLLTANDVSTLAGPKAAFKRSSLPGVLASEDVDSLLYEPEKGAAYGFGLQVFRGRDAEAVRERYAAMLASYPSAQEIGPISGKTFFAWWDEVLFVTFVQQNKNLVVVVSCGRKFCDSDKLYDLARKVSTRAG
jgi:hypothetical protein